MINLLQILLTLAITLLAYRASLVVFRISKQNPILHPLIVCCGSLVALLLWLQIPITDYQQNSQWLVDLLGPATVALGIPLYKNLNQLKRHANIVILPLLLGALASPLTAILILYWLDAEQLLINSMVSKAITSPIALDITVLTGGIPAVAVIFVILSGIIGSAIATPIFKRLSIENQISQGLALGVASHAIGTARAFQIGDKCAASSVLAMCLNGVLTTLCVVLFLAVT